MRNRTSRQPIRWEAANLEQNRFGRVLLEASERKKLLTPLSRPSFAAEFFRDNPMPWLLDSDPAIAIDDGVDCV
jgi:hypothetical protein